MLALGGFSRYLKLRFLSRGSYLTAVGKAAFTQPSPKEQHERESASQTETNLAYSEKTSHLRFLLEEKKFSVVFNFSHIKLKINCRRGRKITKDNFSEIFIVPGDVSNNFWDLMYKPVSLFSGP